MGAGRTNRGAFSLGLISLLLGSCTFEGARPSPAQDASNDANPAAVDAAADAKPLPACALEFSDFAHVQSSYRVTNENLRFSEARERCEAVEGGRLAIIEDTPEFNAINAHLRIVGINSVWFGLSQELPASNADEPNGHWFWVNGQPHTPTAFGWADPEPNDFGSEDCAEFVTDSNDVGWNDAICNKRQDALCECDQR